jgi:transposase
MSRPPIFHTYAALAELWGLSVKTLQNWVAADRKAGIETVTRYRVVGHRRREALIHQDDAIALFDRHRPWDLLEPVVRRKRAQ